MEKQSVFKNFIKKPKLVEMALGLICTLFILLTAANIFTGPKSFVDGFDKHIYDRMLNMTLHTKNSAAHVVVIDIDQESIESEGRWPWPRDKMADLINKLKGYGVVTISLDIVMSEPEINYALGLKDKLNKQNNVDAQQKTLINELTNIAPSVDNDVAFAESMRDRNVVLGYLFHFDSDIRKGMLPPPLLAADKKPYSAQGLSILNFKGYNGCLELFLKASQNAGFVTNIPDSDASARHSLLIAQYGNQIYASIALQTAINYLMVNQVSLKITNHKLEGIQLDNVFIPTNPKGQILIPYWGPPGTLNYFSAADILHNKVNPKQLDGAIAIIGSTMTLFSDLHESPVADLFPGVEMVGNIVKALVGQQTSSSYNWDTTQGFVILAVLGLVIAILLPLLGVNRALLLTLILILAILGAALYLFAFKYLYVPCAVLICLLFLQAFVNYSYNFILERRQKKQISDLFGQYVPQDYVKELIEHPENYSMEGETRNMTVLFADIRGFTSLSESLDAAGVKRLLNTFFTPITELIFRHRGTIDKYVGDMIVAFWGAPIKDENHTYNALKTSLTIFKKIPEINEQMTANNLPKVTIGLGLGTGLMNVGDMGSEFRRAYTVLGDTVNLASRLQDLTKFYQVDILTNDSTRENQDDFLWRPVDKVAVKGRKTALTIYTPVCFMNEASAELIAEVADYELALEAYYLQNWQAAENKFTILSNKRSDVYLYAMYLERINDFKTNPPPLDWDGVYTHTHK